MDFSAFENHQITSGGLERFPLRRSNSVAAMPGVIGAFVGREELERSRNQAAHLVVGPRTCGAQECFQFRERELDRIEIGTVGGQKSDPGADLLDGCANLGLLMGREIVEHNDIAATQRRHQHLFDVGEETRTVDRPIEDRRCANPLEPQRGDDGVRLPVTAGRVIPKPCAARAPAIAT